MPHYFSESEKSDLLRLSTIQFWDKVSQCKNYNDIKQFENIGRLANIVLCLPHSNAAVERIFSMVTDIKTKKRNRIATDTLEALVRVKLDMKKQEKHCFDYVISKDMYNLFNSRNIYGDPSTSASSSSGAVSTVMSSYIDVSSDEEV